MLMIPLLCQTVRQRWSLSECMDGHLTFSSHLMTAVTKQQFAAMRLLTISHFLVPTFRVTHLKFGVSSKKGFVSFTKPGAPTWSNHFILRLSVVELDGEFCCHEFCYHEAFEAHKRVFTRLEDNTDNMQSQDKHWGRLGIRHKPGPVQSACLWKIMLAIQHTSEHITCSIETCLNMLLCCMHVHKTMLAATYRCVIICGVHF